MRARDRNGLRRSERRLQPARGVVASGGAAAGEDALRQSLRDLGYVEGRNVILEIRDTQGRSERANDLALHTGPG
jgi:hypothetical protein